MLMSIGSMLLGVAAAQGQYGTFEPFSVLRNGDFEALEPGETLNNPNEVDGLFWIGAEDRTFAGAGNRFLRLQPGAFAYQQFAAARLGNVNYTDDVAISGRVRLNSQSNRATLTLAQTGVPSAMKWAIQQPTGDLDWSLFIWDDASQALAPMTMTVPGEQYEQHGTLVAAPSGRVCHADVGTHPLVAIWTAPFTITGPHELRLVIRVSSRSGSTNQPDTRIQVLRDAYDPNDDTWNPQVLGSATLPAGNEGGQLILVNATAEIGDRIGFHIERLGGSDKSRVFLDPMVTRLSRRLTYVMYSGPLPLLPVDTPFHKYMAYDVGATSFRTFNLPAGSDFLQKHGQTVRPFLEIDLGAMPVNPGHVDFDDLQATVSLPTRTAADLRNAILGEAQSLKERHQEEETLPPPNLPLACSELRLDGQTQGIPLGRFPILLTEVLEHRVDAQDFEGVDQVREVELRLPRTSAGFQYARFICANPPGYEQVTSASGKKISLSGALDNALALYDQTSDPGYLDLGFAYATTLIQQGVLDQSQFNVCASLSAYGPEVSGLILSTASFDADTGAFDPAANCTEVKDFLDKPSNFLAAPAALLQFYAEARALNEALGGAPAWRYPAADLQMILDAAELGLDRAIDLRRYADPGDSATWDWGGVWRAFHDNFNAVYGHQGSAATRAWRRLAPMPFAGETRLTAILHKLHLSPGPDDDVTFDGADHFLPIWREAVARYAVSAADQGRAYGSYLSLITFQHPSLLALPAGAAEAFAAQLKAQAFNCFQHEHLVGVWSDRELDSWQTINYGSNPPYTGMGPPDNWALAQGQALGLDDGQTSYLSAQEKALLLAQLNVIFESTREYFRAVDANGQVNGYYPTIEDELFHHQGHVGSENLTLGAMLRAIPYLDEGTPEAPSVTVSPESFLGQPPGAFQCTIKIQHPDADTAQELGDAMAGRTRVYVWSRPTGSPLWTRTEVWPSVTGVVWNPVALNPNTRTAILSSNSVSTALLGSDGFKVRAVTWDQAGQWDMDTSWQP